MNKKEIFFDNLRFFSGKEIMITPFTNLIRKRVNISEESVARYLRRCNLQWSDKGYFISSLGGGKYEVTRERLFLVD
jgi:predicted transcriptional regulator